jgi:hypothetical protein
VIVLSYDFEDPLESITEPSRTTSPLSLFILNSDVGKTLLSIGDVSKPTRNVVSSDEID